MQTAYSIVGESAAYTPYFSYLIARMELHCSNFTYTPYLQELYNGMQRADRFEAERRQFFQIPVLVFRESAVGEDQSQQRQGKDEKDKDTCESFCTHVDYPP